MPSMNGKQAAWSLSGGFLAYFGGMWLAQGFGAHGRAAFIIVLVTITATIAVSARVD